MELFSENELDFHQKFAIQRYRADLQGKYDEDTDEWTYGKVPLEESKEILQGLLETLSIKQNVLKQLMTSGIKEYPVLSLDIHEKFDVAKTMMTVDEENICHKLIDAVIMMMITTNQISFYLKETVTNPMDIAA